MFSQCPECKSVCYISIAELRSTRGMVVCKQCSVEFNALESLSDVPAILPDRLDNPDHSFLKRWLIKFLTNNSTKFWATGLTICLLSLVLQIYSYQFDAISQNPDLRPKLVSFCRWVKCIVPEYVNLQEISVLQSQMVQNEDYTYQFSSTVTNQAAFSQPSPAIKLILVNFVGEVLAYRIFYSKDYLPENKTGAIDSNETTEITLHIAPITEAVGGYYFEFV